jgi:hypothetical protein
LFAEKKQSRLQTSQSKQVFSLLHKNTLPDTPIAGRGVTSRLNSFQVDDFDVVAVQANSATLLELFEQAGDHFPGAVKFFGNLLVG